MNLSKTTTIADYHRMKAEENRIGIATFVLDRFAERYITPINAAGKLKHGFCTMAVSCLMVEALESFWQGLPDTRGKSEKMFTDFFGRVPEFLPFHPHSSAFYHNVRCGILHQAETRQGWRVVRAGPLFNQATKTINATRFHAAVERALRAYCVSLVSESWTSSVWANLRKKLNAIRAISQ
jgi:hypothetical protein